VIETLTGQGIDVSHACRVLGVSQSGYYAWKTRPLSPRALRRIWLASEIADIHNASAGTYGALRVTAELRHGREIVVGHNAVESIMRQLGIKGLPTRRLPKGARVAKVTSLDLVGRAFARSGPDQLWMTDITEHPTREGKLYCCVVLDAFSRMVVGWSIDSTQTTTLVLNALGMATRRRVPAGELVIHSDRGVQIHLLGLQSQRPRRRTGTIDGRRRQPLRQRHGRIVLGTHAGRTAQPQELEDPDRARHRDPRPHRALPQHPPPTQLTRHAHPDRIRTPPPTHPQRRLTPEPRLQEIGGRSRSPQNSGRLKRPNSWASGSLPAGKN
jgi:transposase InsO family protein